MNLLAATLANLEVFHHDILQSISTGIATTDLDGRITSLNRAALEILGPEMERSDDARRSPVGAGERPAPPVGQARTERGGEADADTGQDPDERRRGAWLDRTHPDSDHGSPPQLALHSDPVDAQ